MLRVYQKRKGRARGSIDPSLWTPLPIHHCGTVSTKDGISLHSLLTIIVPKQQWFFIPKTQEYTFYIYIYMYVPVDFLHIMWNYNYNKDDGFLDYCMKL